MAYDEELARRIEDALAGEPGVTSRRMFGGLGFMVDDHLTVAATEGGVMVRTDPASARGLLESPGVTQVEMRGRAMPGWLLVATEAVPDEKALGAWVGRSVGFVRALPPKHA